MSDAVTREEQYYRAMLGEGTAPKPITRKEKWLNRIAEAIANGGGTGGGGASGGGSENWTLLADITLEEEVSVIEETFATPKKVSEIYIDLELQPRVDGSSSSNESVQLYTYRQSNGVFATLLRMDGAYNAGAARKSICVSVLGLAALLYVAQSMYNGTTPKMTDSRQYIVGEFHDAQQVDFLRFSNGSSGNFGVGSRFIVWGKVVE